MNHRSDHRSKNKKVKAEHGCIWLLGAILNPGSSPKNKVRALTSLLRKVLRYVP